MSQKTWQRIFSTLLLVVMAVSWVSPVSVLAAPVPQVTPADKIEPLVISELSASGQTDFFVWMMEQADLSPAAAMKTKAEKGQFVFETLKATAERTQKDLLAKLDEADVKYQSFYITNKVLVIGGSEAQVLAIAERADVKSITANHQYQLDQPFINQDAANLPTAIEPNISFVNADDVWALGVDGSGTVMAGNDTGLQWNHPAIINQYRGWNGTTADHNYNWWDATDTYPTVPGDGHGHGTHTTGTMVGDDGGSNQIGMAPGAQTVHCKNMTNSGSGSDATFSECFQWDLAPWDLTGANPMPSLAPDAINNSWGYSGGNQPQFKDEIAALQAAGILVEVSAGNEGSSCASLRSPSDYAEVLTTGSVNHAAAFPGSLTGFSSRGPSDIDGGYFPDVMAPGENIRSSVPGSAYEGGWSGTSMAGPHVTALVGLLWDANPSLRGDIAQTTEIIAMTAVPLTGVTGSNCGGDYITGPNNDWGVGTIDALAAVEEAIARYGDSFLNGYITEGVIDAPGDPIAGALVQVEKPGDVRTANTDASGYYTMTLFSDTYTVTVWAYGYEMTVEPDVYITGTTTLNIQPLPADDYVISGTVADSVTGDPLWATVAVAGQFFPPPVTEVETNPASGYYELTVSGGQAYTLTASSLLHTAEVRPIGDPMGNQTQDFDLVATTTDGGMAGYVYNFYTNDPIEGAVVTVDSAGNPSGETDAAGYYEILGLPAGFYTATAEADLYSPVTLTDIEVLQSNIALTDFYLPTSHLVFDPAALEKTLTMGETDSDASGLVITNTGLGDLTFELSEKAGGFMPADQAAALNVLLMTEGIANIQPYRDALTAAGQTWTEITTSPFPTLAELEPYDVLIWADQSSLTPDDTSCQIVVDWLNSGGKSLFATSYDFLWDLQNGGVGLGEHNLYLMFNTTYVGDYAGTGILALNGVAGDPIGNGLTLTLAGATASNGDYANETLGAPTSFLYGAGGTGSGRSAFTYYEGANYQAAWLGVNFHDGLTDQAQRDELMTRIFDFFGGGGPGSALPWITETPVSGTLSTDQSAAITLDWDASVAEVTQPGVYTGTIEIINNDPVAQDTLIPVTLNVLPSVTQGKLEGVVTSLGYCNAAPAPIEGAEVYLEGSAGYTMTLETNASGFYQYWVDEAQSPFTITVTAPEHSVGLATDVVVTGLLTTTVDFDLTWLFPCVGVDPAALSVSVELGMTTTLPMTITNDGGVDLSFELAEKPGEFTPGILAGEDVLVVRYDTTAATAMENALAANGFTYLGVTDAVFQTYTVLQLLEYSAVFYAGSTSTNARTLLMSYLDAGGALYISDNDLGFFNGSTPFYQTYLQATYISDDPGITTLLGEDIMSGLNLDVSTDPYPDDFSVNAEGVRIFQFQGGNAAGVRIDRNGYLAIYTSFDFDDMAANSDETALVARIMGYLAVSDVPWMSEVPVSGTLPVAGMTPVVVSFDASGVEITDPGTYTADLVVKSNDPLNGRMVLPVEMNVTAPDDWGYLSGVVTSTGYCDINPVIVADAAVNIQSAGGFSVTVATDAAGEYFRWLEVGTYTVTVSKVDFSTETDIVDVTSGSTPVLDFTLRWLKPCVTVSLDAISVQVVLGASETVALDLGNLGGADLTFELKEQDGGFSPWLEAISRETPARTQGNPAQAETGRTSGQPVTGQASGGAAPEDIGDAWETMAPMPAGRVFNAVVADTNGYVYVLGGTSDAGGATPTSTNYRYNTATNVWDTMAPIPTTMSQIDGIVINDMLYIPGDSNTATTYVYDIAADTWSQIAANGGYSARGQYQVVAIGTDVYVLGGIVGSASTTEVWVLDTTTGVWSAGVPMQKSRTSFSAAAIGDQIYVAGGVLFPGFTPDMTAEMFDGSGWSYVASLPDGGGAYTRWSYNADGLGADGLWLGAGRRDTGWAVLNHAGFYNPDSDTWTDSPTIPTLAQGRVYMEGDVAADGYFYVIGGRDSAGTIIYPTNERLMVGTAGGGDVPWLFEDPASGTVAPDGGSVSVDVTLDSSVVLEPGEYFATLKVSSNDPMYANINVPVTMTVSGDENTGKLDGMVYSLGSCDINPVPAEGAQVLVEGASDTFTVTTDANGYYALWIDQAQSPLILTVSAADHEDGFASGVIVTGQMTTTVDFDLRWLAPCTSVTPDEIEVTVGAGYSVTEILTIWNNGAGAADFELAESGGGMASIYTPDTVTTVPNSGSPLRLNLFAPAAAGASIAAPLDDVIVDGGFEAGPYGGTWNEYSLNFGTPLCDVAGCGTGTGTGPNSGTYWAWFGGVAAYEEGSVDQDVFIPFGTAELSFWLEQILCDSPADYLEVTIDDQQVFYSDGSSPICGVLGYSQVTVDVSDFADGAMHNIMFYSEIFANNGSGTNIFVDDVMLDVIPGSPDVAWLSEAPVTGTIGADSFFEVDVTFDSLTYTVGTYTATLKVMTNDPATPEVEVPVTMNVVEVVYGVSISPDDSLTGEPGETVVYEVIVTNESNGPMDSFDLALGASDWTAELDATTVGPLAPGESASVHVSVTVPEDVVLPDDDVVQVTATSQGDPTQSASADLTTVAGGDFGVDLNPEASAATGEAGDVITYTLRLTNTGTTTDTFGVSVAGAGAAWTTLPVSSFDLAGGASADVIVVVTIPADAEAGDYPITVTATSAHDPSASDEVEVTTTVVITGYIIYLPTVIKLFP